MKRIVILLLICLSSVYTVGQCIGNCTNVTATLVDTTGQVWSNATVNITLIPPFGNPAPMLNNGLPINSPLNTVTTNGLGQFTISLDDNSQIFPTGSRWKFSMCPNATVTNCSDGLIYVNGTSQDLSASLNSYLIPPMVNSGPSIQRAYKDSEAIGGTGSVYWDTVNNVLKGCAISPCNWTIIGNIGVPGSNQYIPFNNGLGAFGADVGLQWNNITKTIIPTNETLSGILVASVINNDYYPATCGGPSPPTWCIGSDIGSWTNAAWAACGGCRVVWPTGTFAVTTPIIASVLADSIKGSGISNTILTYAGSVCPLVIQPTTFTVGAAGEFSDFQIIGISAGQCGIHINDVTNAKISRVEVGGFTTGTGFWLDSTVSGVFGPAWTERTTFWDSWSNNNLIGWRFTTNGGTGSFARTDLHSCHANTNGAQTVVSVESGSTTYDSRWEVSGNMSGTSGTVFSVTGTNTKSDNGFYDLRFETAGLPATLINIASGDSLTGSGSFGQSTWTCSIATNANFYISGAFDPCAQFNPRMMGPWSIMNWPVNNFLFGIGGNTRFDGFNYQIIGDGSHNGGFAILGSEGNPSIGFYVVPDTSGVNQSVSPATFATYLSGTIDSGGFHGKGIPILTSFTTTAATTDNVTVTGMTASGHCDLQPTNAGAAGGVASTYVSNKTTNQITVTHTATAGWTFDVLCTSN